MFNRFIFVSILLLLILFGCNTTGQPDRVVRVDEVQTAFSPKISASEITFSLDPFKSFPGNFADVLADSLVIKAKAREIRISRSLRIKTTHRIIGQISAVGGDNGTVVLYAFDIRNSEGTRVYRINGQETAGGTSGDPWVGVHHGTINNISEKVISEINAWLSRAFNEIQT